MSNPYAGTDLYGLVPGLILYRRLSAAYLHQGLEWVLPADPSALPGVTTAYGLPVVRHAGNGLYLAHRFGTASTEGAG